MKLKTSNAAARHGIVPVPFYGTGRGWDADPANARVSVVVESSAAGVAIVRATHAQLEHWGAAEQTSSRPANVREVPVAEIRRPLGRVRSNDQSKVDALKRSISEHGLLEPIDVLEVNGVIYGA